MKKIFIFGSSGFAKEVYFLISEINKKELSYEIGGFIDIEPKNTEIQLGSKNVPVYNEPTFFKDLKMGDSDTYSFALGMGTPAILKKIKAKYLHQFDFPNLIHPNVTGYFDAITLGKGNIVTSGCIFTIDIQIGNLNLFNLHTTLGHDSVIGDCNVFNPGVNISGGVTIGDENLFGTNSSILQYITVGSNNTIGAGAMVNKAIGNGLTVVGIPAKEIVRK